MMKMIWNRWVGRLDGRPVIWIKNLITIYGRVIDLHKMVDTDDEGCFHTHPAYAIRIVLWGGYIEELEDGTLKTWFPGRFGIVEPSYSHRIAMLLNHKSSYSLWIRFRKTKSIELRGPGWDKQRDRLDNINHMS